VAHLVVDAMNVIGSRPTGWWRDRDAAVRLLVERLQALAASSGDQVTLVVDGRPQAELPEGDHGGVRVLYAPRAGRNAADDRIVRLLDAEPDTRVEVITSDRGLAERAAARGATVRGASWLLDRLDAADR
jgi:predicted RNA-binding protein with PIN domain